MKTTIDIPEPLYKKAKIRAVEQGQTLKTLMLTSLQRELENTASSASQKPVTWGTRKLVPGFAHLQNTSVLTPKPGDRDITDLISEDRDAA